MYIITCVHRRRTSVPIWRQSRICVYNLSGQLRIMRQDVVLGPGDHIGAAILHGMTLRSATTVSLTKSELVAIGKNDFARIANG